MRQARAWPPGGEEGATGRRGGHCDLADLLCGPLSSGFLAITADRGLWPTLSSEQASQVQCSLSTFSQLLFVGLTGRLVWTFPRMDLVSEPLPVLGPLPGLPLLGVPICTL